MYDCKVGNLTTPIKFHAKRLFLTKRKLYNLIVACEAVLKVVFRLKTPRLHYDSNIQTIQIKMSHPNDNTK